MEIVKEIIKVTRFKCTRRPRNENRDNYNKQTQLDALDLRPLSVDPAPGGQTKKKNSLQNQNTSTSGQYKTIEHCDTLDKNRDISEWENLPDPFVSEKRLQTSNIGTFNLLEQRTDLQMTPSSSSSIDTVLMEQESLTTEQDIHNNQVSGVFNSIY